MLSFVSLSGKISYDIIVTFILHVKMSSEGMKKITSFSSRLSGKSMMKIKLKMSRIPEQLDEIVCCELCDVTVY